MAEVETLTDVPSIGGGPLIAEKPQVRQIKDIAEAEALPPGTTFLDPSGVKRIKPYEAKHLSDVADIPEGAQFVDPQGTLRQKPKYEGIDFTAQTLYDMALTPKEKKKALERSYPGKVKEGPDGLYIEDEGTFRKPGRGVTGITGFMTSAAAPAAGAVLGTLGGGAAGALGGPAGAFVGSAAGGFTGAATGQGFNDMVLQLAGVFDRTPGEEAGNLAVSGFSGMFGAGVGRGAATVVPSTKAGVSALTAALPKATASFLGSTLEDTEHGLKLAEKGVLVPPSAHMHESPHVQNIVEVFDPAFRTNKPLRESAVGYYEKETGRILDELGVDVPEKTEVTPLRTGERIMQRTLAESAEADARLQQALERRAAELEEKLPGEVAQRESIARAAQESRNAAQKLIDQGFNDISRDADAAMKVAEAGHYSGDLWEHVGAKLRAIRQGIAERARYWYDRYDAMTGGAKVSSEELSASAQQMLDELPVEFKSRNPVLVDKLAKLAKETQVEGAAEGITEVTHAQLTYGQLHDLRSVFRNSADWHTLSSDFKNGALKRFSNEIDRLLHGENEPEMITGAAVKIDGRVFTGPNHYAAVEQAAKTLNRPIDEIMNQGEKFNLGGFVTTNGRFVSREDAFKIAGKVDQVDIDPDLKAVGWNPNFLVTEDMPRRYGSSQEVQRVKKIKEAGKFLDMVDAWYGKNIKIFNAKQMDAVMKGLAAGEPADPATLYNVIVKEGHTDLMERIKKMVGPNLWHGIAAADMRAMLDASKTLEPGVIDARKFAREVLERYRANTLSVVHGEASEKLLAQARAIEQLDGRLPIPSTANDTLSDVIRRARNEAEKAKTVADKDPLGAIKKEADKIRKQNTPEARQGLLKRARKNDPLAFFYDPTVGAIEAVNKVLNNEDLLLAAAVRFGEHSPEFGMLRRLYVSRILDSTLTPSVKLKNISPEVQRIMFPGATLDEIHELAKDMDFLMTRRGMGRTTAGSMSAMSKIENPVVGIRGLKTAAKFVPGLNPAARAIKGKFYAMVTYLATRPATFQFILKGLKGTPEERAAVKRLTDKVLQKGAAVGAGGAVSTEQGINQ